VPHPPRSSACSAALVQDSFEWQTCDMKIQSVTPLRRLPETYLVRLAKLLLWLLPASLIILTASCVNPGPSTEPPVPSEHATLPEPGEDALGPKQPAGKDREITRLIVDPFADAISGLAGHGLDPEDYHLSHILSLTNDPVAQQAVSKQAWTLAATHLMRGRLDPETLLPRRHAGFEQMAMFERLMDQGGPAALAGELETLAPQHPAYIALRAELTRERTAMAMASDPAEWDAHAASVNTIMVNLERWRWLPRDLGQRYVMANIASFQVEARQQDSVQEVHTAIFGKLTRETPVFSDSIEFIVFNPWWEVPTSIARHDKLAQFKKDPGLVKRLGYQVLDTSGHVVDPSGVDWSSLSAASFPYRLRQAPGPRNALGQVKIMFPNLYNVYLHDTPDKGLYDAEQRTFSSGCIRVGDPVGLAQWLLEDTPGWNREQVDTAIASGSELRVDLLAPIPVHIVYFTVAGDSCEGVHYLRDVYDRDGAVLKALRAALEP
jgi:murein L,D-transpeptidase YcbB/YkuD